MNAEARGGAATRYLAERRAPIAAALEGLAARRGGELSLAPGGAAEAMARIAEFCLRGKMVRGCLVYLGAEAAPAEAAPAEAAPAGLASLAAGMELFQAGLLIHDDIMDRDELRRGAPTIHARYAAEAAPAGGPGAEGAGAGANERAERLHLGESLGICLGDLCYFEGFAALARALGGSPRAGAILGLCAERLSEVAVAQMADVRWGSGEAEPSEAEILAMYRCKTARYSFSLPLSAGALFAGAPELVGPLTELGERLGVLFQVRDDELGLFGAEGATGKAVGSDLREGKKTLIRSRLLAAAPREERPRLEALFSGRTRAEDRDIGYIRRLYDAQGVALSIAELSREAEEAALKTIGGLHGLAPGTRAALEGLVEYVGHREG